MSDSREMAPFAENLRAAGVTRDVTEIAKTNMLLMIKGNLDFNALHAPIEDPYHGLVNKVALANPQLVHSNDNDPQIEKALFDAILSADGYYRKDANGQVNEDPANFRISGLAKFDTQQKIEAYNTTLRITDKSQEKSIWCTDLKDNLALGQPVVLIYRLLHFAIDRTTNGQKQSITGNTVRPVVLMIADLDHPEYRQSALGNTPSVGHLPTMPADMQNNNQGNYTQGYQNNGYNNQGNYPQNNGYGNQNNGYPQGNMPMNNQFNQAPMPPQGNQFASNQAPSGTQGNGFNQAPVQNNPAAGEPTSQDDYSNAPLNNDGPNPFGTAPGGAF